MEKTVKVIPEKNIKSVTLANLEKLDDNSISVKINDSSDFEIHELFEIIVEDSNELTIGKANLAKKDGKSHSFTFIPTPRTIKKREYERCHIKLPVEANGFEGETLNISAGGMQLKSQKSLKENKTYKLTILFEDKKIDVEYEVLRQHKNLDSFITAGKFTQIEASDKAFIIQQNLKKKIDIRYNSNKGDVND